MRSLFTTGLLVILTAQVLSAQDTSVGSKQKAGGRLQGHLRQTALLRTQMKEAERLLAQMGYWTGAVDGVFDPATRSALIAFQKWERRPVTEKLTLDELEAIRLAVDPANKEAWPKARDAAYKHVEVDIDRQVLLIVDEELDADGTNSGVAGRNTGSPSHPKVRVLPVSTGNDKPFMEDGQQSVAYTPRGRFVVYDKSFGWEQGALGSMYYSNYISGGVAIHGHPNVPNEPASHGCIRIPMFAAREVSRLMKLGTIVLVYDKVSFVSAREWAENPELKRAVMLESKRPDYRYQVQGTSVIKKSRRRVNRAE